MKMRIKRYKFIPAVFLLLVLLVSSGPALTAEPSTVVEFNPDDLVIWAFGDIQPRNQTDRGFFELSVEDVSLMKNVDASLCVGDIVQNKTGENPAESFEWFYNTYKRAGIKDIFEIAGNHDARDIDSYLKASGKPLHYSVQYGNLIIILLSDEKNSSGSDISDGAFLWWKNILETNRDKNIITMTHSHLGGSGFVYNLISYRNVQGSERFTEVLKKEKVELWLCGHTHIPSFFGLSKRQISSLNDTVFMNVASIREDFVFSDAESRFIT
ncbi:MAG: hypothetical protein CVV49_05135, partial [Spirochaetae bacterium HGW-Spirochaetae-5]